MSLICLDLLINEDLDHLQNEGSCIDTEVCVGPDVNQTPTPTQTARLHEAPWVAYETQCLISDSGYFIVQLDLKPRCFSSSKFNYSNKSI